MRTLFALCLFGTALGLVLGQPASPTRGKVLLLHNEHTIEGDIERVGDHYRIRRGNSEMLLPIEKALFLSSDWKELYGVMRSRANLQDPDERLRLARWAYLNNLRKEAFQEAKAAADMRPQHQPSKQMVSIYARALEAELERDTNNPITPVANTPSRPVPTVDLSAEALALFTTKVQPILLNTCVSCHHPGKPGEFLLVPAYQDNYRVAQQKNLAMVIRQLNLDRPQASQLLVKAASAHGGFTQPPIKGGRQSAPFHTLSEWVELVIANNPHLKEPSRPTSAFANLPPTRPETIQINVPKEAQPFAQNSITQPAPATMKKAPETGDPFAPESFNRPDPFDPGEFNRGITPPQKQ